MNPLVRLLRPLNCVLAAVSVPIVMLILFGLTEPSTDLIIHTLLGMAVVSFFTGGGNTLNDYVDRDVDKINHPERPIPSGEISPKNALYLSVSLFAVSLLSSLFLPWFLPQVIVLISIILMISYEFGVKHKGLAGNAVISWLTGSLFVFAGAIYGDIFLPLILGILAGLSTMGREIIKDIQDMKGDLDRETFPMKVGLKNAKISILIFILIAVSLSPLPYLLGSFSVAYLTVVILADIIFIYSLTFIDEPKKSQSYIKFAMMVALIAFIFGGIL